MYPQIILLGDSLIQRSFDPATPSFGPALQHTYFRRADIVNRGFGGYNSEWLLPVLLNQILPSVADVILWIILIGANDAMLAPGPNHVPIDTYRQNLVKVIDAIAIHHLSLDTPPRIILFTPPPISQSLIAEYLPQHKDLRKPETTYVYAQAVMNLTVPTFVEKVNLYEAIQIAPAQRFIQNPQIPTNGHINHDPVYFENGGMVMGLEDYLSDGLHLKDLSYAIMYKLAMTCIQKRWPEIIPENMKMPVPWWGDIVSSKRQQQKKDEL